MAASPVFVFQALSQNEQPAAAVLNEFKKQEGFQRALFGVKMEDPETGVLCTEWSSAEAATSYRSSQLGTSLGAKETLAFAAAAGEQQQQQQQQQGWRAALGAPCTEVFTAFGVEDGFAEGNVGRFVSAVGARPPEGFEGLAFGESVQGDDGGGEERAVRMVIGWVSREAHLEAKGAPGAIQENIHELRVLRRAVDLFHVAFREL
ncbi:hypothetical protein C8A01DRAFT_42716 [Parachaetomium inaequale]|uniref:ABM domain-containing protein n=1 Tax=Parachaetomium inaequale TaxID=2588326 RepID=A0AAN6PTF2_9PEZI|nr:hypothetical protein C8A01DRAFT_42716 [Parachaetomium inaequale]